jgi:plasmid segregation protein ParM
VILGIDAGNYYTKIAGHYGVLKMYSDLGEWRERNLKNKHGEDDIEYEYKGKKGFAGTLAKYESEFSGSIMGSSKAHHDTLIRVLLAICKYIQHYNIHAKHFKIVVGQPINTHTPEEKQQIIEMLQDKHDIKFNNHHFSFYIESVKVAAEGVSAFWSYPLDGLVRIIDIGSGTINCATVFDKRYIDKDSFTIEFGMNTNKNNNMEYLARAISTHTLKKWGKKDRVFVVGGSSEKAIDEIKKYHPLAEVLHPHLNGYTLSKVHPVYANAVAFYHIGEVMFNG